MSESKPTERLAEDTTPDTKTIVPDGQELTDADLAQVAGGSGDPHVSTTSLKLSERAINATGELIGH